LLVPYIDKNADMKTIIWDTIRISGGNDSIISKAAKKMLQNEQIVTKWAPALLLMELDNVLWREKDSIPVKTLWEYLCTYCYLPRLSGESVLMDAIQTGLNSTEYFAFASGFDGNRYIDRKLNQYVGIIERSGMLVKLAVAKKQIEEEEAKRQADAAARAAQMGGASIPASVSGEGYTPSTIYPTEPTGAGTQEVHESPAAEQPKNKRFFMSADLDTTRINRDVQKYVEEIIQHLTSVDGATVKVSLEVEAISNAGFSQQTMRTVTENCRTLRVRSFGFDDE
ncbi:MAG: hypothetical protein LBR31_07730, partial [Desulfovibrio sp.]|nr:hypothetical protein [Desulfovibrio sp.]